MLRWLVVLLLIVGCSPEAASSDPCSDAWLRFVEESVPTGDGQGHGPDVGSGEWRSVVEFKLGIRGEPGVPPRESDAWCRHIDEIVRARGTPMGGACR